MTAAAPRQLVLDLGHRPALGAEDFLVSASNARAVDLIDRWPAWPAPAAIVVGPHQSGKTHLANVWRHKSGAAAICAADLGEDRMGDLGHAPALVVEDIERGIGCERTLFHLMNLAREHQRGLLLTTSVVPAEIEVGLPDLRSRLRGALTVAIERPDDGLLRAVLVKHFADRQLQVEPQVINTLLITMERTMAAAADTVEAIDRLALATRRKVTRALVAQALAGLKADASGPTQQPN
jgi:chromosomal replication initiation ATPase DnaA